MPIEVAPVVAPGSMADRVQPVLTVDELVLRPWTAADAADVVAAYADPAIQHWHLRSMTTAEASAWVAAANAAWFAETAASWAITRRSQFVGRLAVRAVNLGQGVAEMAYWVVPAARGHGIAPRALRLVSEWALTDLGLHRLALEHSTRNPASCRVAEKAGYLLEGTMRSHLRHDDGWHDMHLHALVSSGRP